MHQAWQIINHPIRHNDTFSYHKEHAIGATQNIMHLYRQEGLSQQQAYDQVEILMRKRYTEWYTALAEIPWWGEEVDAQVMLYLEGCQNQVLGNLNWRWVSSFAGQCSTRINPFLFISSHFSFPHSVSFVMNL